MPSTITTVCMRRN